MEENQPVELTDFIDISYFKNVKLKVAQILSARKVPETDKLMELRISLGDEERTLVAGIALAYSPDELPGKYIIVVSNLKPAKLKGITSQGMLLAARDATGLSLLTIDRPVSPGSLIS